LKQGIFSIHSKIRRKKKKRNEEKMEQGRHAKSEGIIWKNCSRQGMQFGMAFIDTA